MPVRCEFCRTSGQSPGAAKAAAHAPRKSQNWNPKFATRAGMAATPIADAVSSRKHATAGHGWGPREPSRHSLEHVEIDCPGLIVSIRVYNKSFHRARIARRRQRSLSDNYCIAHRFDVTVRRELSRPTFGRCPLRRERFCHTNVLDRRENRSVLDDQQSGRKVVSTFVPSVSCRLLGRRPKVLSAQGIALGNVDAPNPWNRPNGPIIHREKNWRVGPKDMALGPPSPGRCPGLRIAAPLGRPSLAFLPHSVEGP